MISDPFTKEWVGILPPENCAQVNTRRVAPPGGRGMGEVGILFSVTDKNEMREHGETGFACWGLQVAQGQKNHVIHGFTVCARVCVF